MCTILDVSRSGYYYELQRKESNRWKEEKELTILINDIFHQSRRAYGSRKIKVVLKQQGKQVSRRRIARIMRENDLVSKYNAKRAYKPSSKQNNEAEIANVLNRDFSSSAPLRVLASDLTYVDVAGKWNYVCLFVDLFNREIIGYSAGANKDHRLVMKALASIPANLQEVAIFHTDRGKEFDNQVVDEALAAFQIERSLSSKGCPYDNAVAESTFKSFKTEFVNGRAFKHLQQLQLELADYVHWFNHCRIHENLNYITPIQFKENTLKKLSS
ncbi:Transposase InsO and inactivated derivatives [Virgibacillus chiguensis]|uniref:Transposase InsO and inactivated derivatives n=3 Tax=Virgibacillus chiguensis TaxID=411959 RepID=A0A1M5MHN0_9BACI|nr:Transposase InsO and inactivated derivatives [Virgibacillus chiguensis]